VGQVTPKAKYAMFAAIEQTIPNENLFSKWDMLPPSLSIQCLQPLNKKGLTNKNLFSKWDMLPPNLNIACLQPLDQNSSQQEFVQQVGHVTPKSQFSMFATIEQKHFPTSICSASGTCYPQIYIFNA
jgi:hypothetical protein